ncbi:hypothetical protein O3P69_013908 [Scylla paramamosain]|uniref:Uncharacterized protein n=1 Tax=Scylla paramamosain TaxID=85552 RepID=A0AAW0SQC2_SCYPA
MLHAPPPVEYLSRPAVFCFDHKYFERSGRVRCSEDAKWSVGRRQLGVEALRQPPPPAPPGKEEENHNLKL